MRRVFVFFGDIPIDIFKRYDRVVIELSKHSLDHIKELISYADEINIIGDGIKLSYLSNLLGDLLGEIKASININIVNNYDIEPMEPFGKTADACLFISKEKENPEFWWLTFYIYAVIQ